MMRQRPLGKTGLIVSELCLGTFGLSGDGYGPVADEDARKVVARALDIGITCIETADAYGAGRMEHLLGSMVAGRSDVLVVTKGGIDRATEPGRRRFEPEYLEAAIGRSCLRLKKPALDLYLLHHPSEELLLKGEIGGQMKALVEKGLIRHWGVAAGNHEIALLAIDQGAEVVELPYNLLHPIDVNRIGGEAIVSRVGVLARSTLAYGLLGGAWSREQVFPEGDHRSDRWTRNELETRIDHLALLRFLVRRDVSSLRGAAVRFVLANHVVSGAVLGPRTEAQLTELVRDAGVGPRYLSDDDIREVYRALEKVGIPV
jgi:aryl-alcohol dehydrogenase-like predicted oxidoreductase